jgi:hypothetical protein
MPAIIQHVLIKHLVAGERCCLPDNSLKKQNVNTESYNDFCAYDSPWKNEYPFSPIGNTMSITTGIFFNLLCLFFSHLYFTLFYTRLVYVSNVSSMGKKKPLPGCGIMG